MADAAKRTARRIHSRADQIARCEAAVRVALQNINITDQLVVLNEVLISFAKGRQYDAQEHSASSRRFRCRPAIQLSCC